jgi:NADH dehydrogenase FAD-containing subunit
MYLDKTVARRAETEVVLISRRNSRRCCTKSPRDLYPSDIVNPLRRIPRHLQVVEGEVGRIDLDARKVVLQASERALLA